MRARNVDVNGLERELAEFRDIIDGWINENVARERRLKDAHERNLHRLEREYEGLIERSQLRGKKRGKGAPKKGPARR